MEQIIASDIVKPSSPTPVEFKTHILSSLDQVMPSIYIPLIFFYENDESKQQEEISRRLKQSLSEILTVFYPLAGTIKQNSFVDCNDRGAEFVEARVHARLAQFIQHPKMEELKQLIPVDSSSYNDNAIHLSVKTSYFDCGGISVGVCLSHKLGDTSSFVRFLNAWAATCRGESSRIIHPSFDLALHFPPRDSLVSGFHTSKEKIITKRYVFDTEKLEKLTKLQTAAFSRVEAVSAFIWRSFIEANKAKLLKTETSSSSSVASYVVPIKVPPLPDHTFGNCFTFASAVVSSSEEDDDDDDDETYISKLRAAIRAVDNKYLCQTIDQAGDLFNAGNCVFISWRRFPVYDVDFGWGKPVWVCTATIPYANFVVLIDTPSGDGIEAWVNIPHDHFFQLTFQANYNSLLN